MFQQMLIQSTAMHPCHPSVSPAYPSATQACSAFRWVVSMYICGKCMQLHHSIGTNPGCLPSCQIAESALTPMQAPAHLHTHTPPHPHVSVPARLHACMGTHRYTHMHLPTYPPPPQTRTPPQMCTPTPSHIGTHPPATTHLQPHVPCKC